MKGKKYIAWLDGQSVAVGQGEREVEEKARAIFESDSYRSYGDTGTVTLRITTYGRQTLCKAIVLNR